MEFKANLQFSRQALILFSFLYAVLGAAVYYCEINHAIQFVVLLVVLTSGYHCFKRRIYLKSPKSIKQIQYLPQTKRWVFTRQNGQQIRGVLQPESFYSRLIHVISIKEASKRYSVVIWPDSVGYPHFFRLLALIKGHWA